RFRQLIRRSWRPDWVFSIPMLNRHTTIRGTATEQLGSLGQSVRRTATIAMLMRSTCTALVTATLVSVLAALGWFHVLHDPWYPISRAQNEQGLQFRAYTWAAVVYGALPAAVVGWRIAGLLVERYRCARRQHVRKQLLALPEGQRESAARMLMQIHGVEAREIVRPMLHELGLGALGSTEVVPSTRTTFR